MSDSAHPSSGSPQVMAGDSQPSLGCRGLSKSFDGVQAVCGVSLDFSPGEVAALIGPNGAGKTTLFHLFTGALEPDEGIVSLGDQRINRLPDWRIARFGLGRLFQDVRVHRELTVLENVMLGFKDQKGENLVRALLTPRRVAAQEDALSTRAHSWLEKVGLEDERARKAGELSFGKQKLLGIARMLAGEATVLLFDEPTSGVHTLVVDRLMELLAYMAREGRTIVFIEHDMTVVANLAHVAHFMDRGEVISSGAPDILLRDPDLRDRFLGLAPERE